MPNPERGLPGRGDRMLVAAKAQQVLQAALDLEVAREHLSKADDSNRAALADALSTRQGDLSKAVRAYLDEKLKEP